MYAIRRRKTHHWLSKVNANVPIKSTKRLILGEIPMLYEHALLAHVDMVQEHLCPRSWEIVEVEVKEKVTL